MSQALSAYHMSWSEFLEGFSTFYESKEGSGDFWPEEGENLYDILAKYGKAYEWPTASNAWAYNFVFHSFYEVDKKNPVVTDEYKSFLRVLEEIVCEGSPGVNDTGDERLMGLEVVYSAYSPEHVSEIAKKWRSFDWEFTRSIYEQARLGDFSWEYSVQYVKDWIEMFEKAAFSKMGVVTILA